MKRKIKYEFKIKRFGIESSSSRDEYEQLMNDLWNDPSKYEQFLVDKNWDKTGSLTIVVQYVVKQIENVEAEPSHITDPVKKPKEKVRSKPHKMTVEKVTFEQDNPNNE